MCYVALYTFDLASFFLPSFSSCTKTYIETVFPTQLPRNSLQYEWEEDTRPDYEGLAIVNMTWERQEGYEYISSYEISVFSQTDECGGEMILLRFDGIGKVRILIGIYTGDDSHTWFV